MRFKKEEKIIFRKNISYLLVQARKSAHLTQKRVAQKRILSQSELSKLERGIRQVDIIVLAELASLYKKRLTELIPEPLLNKFLE